MRIGLVTDGLPALPLAELLPAAAGHALGRVLRSAGYDDVLSTEHEGLALPPLYGVRGSVAVLRSVLD